MKMRLIIFRKMNEIKNKEDISMILDKMGRMKEEFTMLFYVRAL